MTPAEIAALPPGSTVVVTAEVANPEPDRRRTRDWRHRPTVAAGTRLVVTLDRDSGQIELVPVRGASFMTLRLRRDGTPTGGMFGALAAAVLPALAPAAPSLGTLARALGYSTTEGAAYTAVREMLRTGALTLAQVEAAIHAAEARPEEE